MDPVRNPFAPGAGSQPPELAGRETIIEDASMTLQRAMRRRPARSQILLGVRGAGKTVLLNKVECVAADLGHVTSFIEAPEQKTLAELLAPRMHQAIRQLSTVEAAKAAAHRSLRALKSFAAGTKVSALGFSIEVDPEVGIADSGNLEFDLVDLFLRIGETAHSAGRAWTLLIDEIQYLDEAELAALIVALHRTNQKSWPVVFFGAGLPQVAALSGDAKSYAERLFAYPPVGPLGSAAARAAIREPIEEEGESITDDALSLLFDVTKGYPYFLQEWGYQTWNIADGSPIRLPEVERASAAAIQRLDDGFFRVRFDRLTPKEREYVFAMAQLGAGPYRSSDVADKLGEPIQKLGPRRAQIIAKGMIYSPAHGDIAFTVPMFEEYLRRNWL